MLNRISTALLLAGVITSSAHAAPYTGSAAPCTAPNTPSTCKVDITDFMKSQFTYTRNGETFTSDSTNLNAAANSARTSSFRYLKRLGVITYDYENNTVNYPTGDQYVKQGFMNHPRLPNVLLHSKTQYMNYKGGPLEIFRYAGGNDNALYVTAEAQWSFGGYHSVYIKEPAPNMHWIHRGYFWANKVQDVTLDPTRPGEWKSASRTWFGLGLDQVDANSRKIGHAYDDKAWFTTFVRFIPNVYAHERGLNDGGGELPTIGTLELLEVVVQKKLTKDGDPVWWEKFVYARQKLANGAYNSFGLVRFVSTQDYSEVNPQTGQVYPRAKCGASGAPKSNLICAEDGFVLKHSNHYNAFYNANHSQQYYTVKEWYDNVLAGAAKFKNDPKFTKRTNPDDTTLPHNRGGFVPPGNGGDAKGNSVLGSTSSTGGEMMYLENTTFEQDWYIYPNGKDPLFAPGASPTNYCREGYRFLGSIPVGRSYNGLTGVEENTGGLHFAIVCGSSVDGFLHPSNAGEASCPTNYITRGWFARPSNFAVTTCTTAGVCSEQNKAYVNFCVNGTETKWENPVTNP